MTEHNLPRQTSATCYALITRIYDSTNGIGPKLDWIGYTFILRRQVVCLYTGCGYQEANSRRIGYCHNGYRPTVCHNIQKNEMTNRVQIVPKTVYRPIADILHSKFNY